MKDKSGSKKNKVCVRGILVERTIDKKKKWKKAKFTQLHSFIYDLAVIVIQEW
jgi:hypothetical protein